MTSTIDTLTGFIANLFGYEAQAAESTPPKIPDCKNFTPPSANRPLNVYHGDETIGTPGILAPESQLQCPLKNSVAVRYEMIGLPNEFSRSVCVDRNEIMFTDCAFYSDK